MFWPHMGGFGWGGWIVGGLVMLLFVGALITLVFFLVRTGGGNRSNDQQQKAGSDALEILKLRYARGELSKEEFEQIRSDLIS